MASHGFTAVSFREVGLPGESEDGGSRRGCPFFPFPVGFRRMWQQNVIVLFSGDSGRGADGNDGCRSGGVKEAQGFGHAAKLAMESKGGLLSRKKYGSASASTRYERGSPRCAWATRMEMGFYLETL